MSFKGLSAIGLCLFLGKFSSKRPLQGFFSGLTWGVLKALRRLVLISFAVLVGFGILSNVWLWSAGVGRSYSRLEQVPPGSVLVLLGTNEFVGQTTIPTGTYRPRIVAAAELAKSGRVKVAVVSGIESGKTWNATVAMAATSGPPASLVRSSATHTAGARSTRFTGWPPLTQASRLSSSHKVGIAIGRCGWRTGCRCAPVLTQRRSARVGARSGGRPAICSPSPRRFGIG